jgi:hypothetical protein
MHKKETENKIQQSYSRATSAAPTYFEVAAIQSIGGDSSCLIDGGVFAGSPALCAWIEARKSAFSRCTCPATTDLHIVSVGTGKEKKSYDYKDARNWATIGWAQPLLDILLSDSEVVDYEMRLLFREHPEGYVRLEPSLGNAKPDMDDASDENIRNLRQAGLDYIDSHRTELDKVVERLIMNDFN